MKILHLLASNKFSGAENVVCQIIKMFDGEIEMVYCSPMGEIANTLKGKDIKFLPLEKLSLKEIKRVVKEYKPDIVHAHDLKATLLASRLKDVKVVSHIHGNKKGMENFSLKALLFLMASKKIDKIFWVSNSCFDDFKFKKQVSNKSSVLPNIIDCIDLEKKVDEDKNNYEYDMIFLGRLVEEKDPLRLVEILRKIKVRLSDINLAIVGDGVFKEDICKMIEDYNLGDNIKLFGFKENPYKILKQAKIMIMTSIREGTPMVALESLALGTPIVSTKTDGMVDLLNGKIGVLYDTNEEAGNIVVDLLQNASKLEKMSQEAIAFSKNYNNIEKYKEKLKREYR